MQKSLLPKTHSESEDEILEKRRLHFQDCQKAKVNYGQDPSTCVNPDVPPPPPRDDADAQIGARWIQGAHLHEGTFTKQARAHGMSVPEFESYVRNHPTRFDSTTRRRANLSHTFRLMHK